jgi:hypothetical protein
VAVPLPLALTVAVNVTVCPPVDGFGLDASAVVVVARFTICDSAGLLLAVLLPFPE